MPGPILRELWWVGGVALLLWIIGMARDQAALFLLFGAIIYLGWHLFNLTRLVNWLLDGKRFYPPDAFGIWGEVYYHIWRTQQHARQRQRRLSALLTRYRESTAALPDATVILSAKGECEWWNNAAKTYLGLRDPLDHNQRIDNLLRDPSFIEFLEAGDYEGRVNIDSPVDPSMKLVIRIVPYAEERRLLVARDVTHLVRMESIRRDFVANASHELRTPLTVISGFLENMGESGDAALRVWLRPIEQMRRQATRMQRILEDLLLLARLESAQAQAKPVNVDVPGMLIAIREEALALSGEQQHRIELETDEDHGLRGNAEELRSAFSNLVNNAVQHTPAGTEITIRWSVNDNGASFEVSDKGEGIARHHLPRLTERFYRTDTARSRERGGTGLGLAIVKHVLQRHNGELQIESVLHEGSTFRAVFPRERVSDESLGTRQISKEAGLTNPI